MELDFFRGGHVENNTGVDPLLRRPTAGGMAGTVFDGLTVGQTQLEIVFSRTRVIINCQIRGFDRGWK